MLIMIISMITIRIGAIAFEITGLPRSKSIFQAVSCYTQTGFTTSESELIAADPRRRKIALFLILFGNASSVTLIAALAGHLYKILDPPAGLVFDIPALSIHIALSQHGHSVARVVELCVLSGASYYFFMHSKTFSKFLDFIKGHYFKHDPCITPMNEIQLDTDGNGVFVLFVRKNSALVGQTLDDAVSILTNREIKLISLVRNDKLIQNPDNAEKILHMDKIICIAQEKAVYDFDQQEAKDNQSSEEANK